MIFTQGNDYSAVLDACVLVPMALCDLLLRLAEEPATYRPFWSDQILTEMTSAMKTKLHRSSTDAAWRRQQMQQAFPEATVRVPSELSKALDCISDADDRHVLAAAIMSRADAIITQTTNHFPSSCLEKFGVCGQTADDFLLHQYHLNPQLVLDKLDDQAAGIAQNREYVIRSLRPFAKEFVGVVEAHTR
jgi:predicted nucleic acid-binding protein